MKTFPTLYHLGKNGALYSWEIIVVGNEIRSSTGQVDGQRVHSTLVATPKNLGKANSTTPEEQAWKEAQAMHKHKLSRKYSLTPEEAREEEIAPMLAQSFEKRKNKNVSYPAHYQNKLDGMRSLARLDDNQVILTSRGYKEWTEVSHINEELGKILGPGDILDGEIYVHGTFTFQKLCSLVKRKQSETLQLEYHVYDMPSCKGEDSLPWRERKNNLMELFTKNPGLKYIKLVPTITVNNEADVVNAHLQSVSDGYEGGMIRLLDGVYDFGHRSNDLLKVKSFDDAEFKVVGATNGVGKFVNACIWICENKNGQQFRVTPKCPQEEKEKYLRESDKYIGKMLTVGYFGLTDDGIPRFPIGKAFRLNEDLTA